VDLTNGNIKRFDGKKKQITRSTTNSWLPWLEWTGKEKGQRCESDRGLIYGGDRDYWIRLERNCEK